MQRCPSGSRAQYTSGYCPYDGKRTNVKRADGTPCCKLSKSTKKRLKTSKKQKKFSRCPKGYLVQRGKTCAPGSTPSSLTRRDGAKCCQKVASDLEPSTHKQPEPSIPTLPVPSDRSTTDSKRKQSESGPQEALSMRLIQDLLEGRDLESVKVIEPKVRPYPPVAPVVPSSEPDTPSPVLVVEKVSKVDEEEDQEDKYQDQLPGFDSDDEEEEDQEILEEEPQVSDDEKESEQESDDESEEEKENESADESEEEKEDESADEIEEEKDDESDKTVEEEHEQSFLIPDSPDIQEDTAPTYLIYPAIWWQKPWSEKLQLTGHISRTEVPDAYIYPVPPDRPQLTNPIAIPHRQLQLHVQGLEKLQHIINSDEFNRQLDNLFLVKENVTWDELLDQVVATWKEVANTEQILNTPLIPGHINNPSNPGQCLIHEQPNDPNLTEQQCNADDQCVFLPFTTRCLPNTLLRNTDEKEGNVQFDLNDTSDMAWLVTKRRQLLQSSSSERNNINEQISDTMKLIVKTMGQQYHMDRTSLDVAHIRYILRLLGTLLLPVPKFLANKIFREDERVESETSQRKSSLILLMLLSANVLNTIGQMSSPAIPQEDVEEEMKQEPGEFAQNQVRQLFSRGLETQDPTVAQFDRPIPVEFLTKYIPHFWGRPDELSEIVIEKVQEFATADESMEYSTNEMMESQNNNWGKGPSVPNSQGKTNYLIQKNDVINDIHQTMNTVETQLDKFNFMVDWGIQGAEEIAKEITTVSKLVIDAVLTAPERIGNRIIAGVGQALGSINLTTATRASKASVEAAILMGELGGLTNNSYVYAPNNDKPPSSRHLDNVELVSTFLWLEAQRAIASDNTLIATDSLTKLSNILQKEHTHLSNLEGVLSNIKFRCLHVKEWTNDRDIEKLLDTVLNDLNDFEPVKQPMTIEVIPDSLEYHMMFGTFSPIYVSQEESIHQVIEIATIQEQALKNPNLVPKINSISDQLEKLELNPTAAIYGATRNLFLTLSDLEEQNVSIDLNMFEKEWSRWKQQLITAVKEVDPSHQRDVLDSLLQSNLIYTREWVMSQIKNLPIIDPSFPALIQMNPDFFQQVIESHNPVQEWTLGEADFFNEATQIDKVIKNMDFLIQDSRSYHDLKPLFSALSQDLGNPQRLVQVGLQEIFHDISTPIFENVINEVSQMQKGQIEEQIMSDKVKENKLFSNIYTNEPNREIRKDAPGFQVQDTPQVRSTALPGIQLAQATKTDAVLGSTSISIEKSSPQMNIFDGGLGRVSVGQIFKGVTVKNNKLESGVFEVTVDGIRKVLDAEVSDKAYEAADVMRRNLKGARMSVLENQTYNVVTEVANLDANMKTYKDMLNVLGLPQDPPVSSVIYQTRGNSLLRLSVQDDAMVALEFALEDIPEDEKANAVAGLTHGLELAQGQKDMYLAGQQLGTQQMVKQAVEEAAGPSRNVQPNEHVKYKIGDQKLTRIQIVEDDDELEVVDIEDFDEWALSDIPKDETYQVAETLKDPGPETIVLEAEALTAEDFAQFQETWYTVHGVTPDLEYVGFSESDLDLKDSSGNTIFSFIVEGGAALSTMTSNQPLQLATLGMSKPVQRVMHKVGLDSWRSGGKMGKPRDLRRATDGRGFHMKVKGMEKAIKGSTFTYWDNTLKTMETVDAFVEVVNKMWVEGFTMDMMREAFTEGILPGYLAYRGSTQWLPFLDLTAQGSYAPTSGMLETELWVLSQAAAFLGPTGVLVANAAAVGFQMYGHIDFALRLYEDPWGTLQKYQDLWSKLMDWHKADLVEMGIEMEEEVKTWEMFQDNVLASRLKAENVNLETNINILEEKLEQFDIAEAKNQQTIQDLLQQGEEVDRGFVERWLEQQSLERQRVENVLAQFYDAQGLGEQQEVIEQ